MQAWQEQVAAEIRRAIAEGEAGPGERLPPARDLAAVIGVNTNTVFCVRSVSCVTKASSNFRRGRGVTVVGTAPGRAAVITRAKDLVQFARRQGFRRDELVEIIELMSEGRSWAR